jgi:hypothetical protein
MDRRSLSLALPHSSSPSCFSKPTLQTLNTQVSARRSASLTGSRPVALAPKLASTTRGAQQQQRGSLVVRAADAAASAPLATGNDVYGGPARLKEAGLSLHSLPGGVTGLIGYMHTILGLVNRCV